MKIARYKFAFAFFDYIILNFAFAVALRLRFRPQIDIVNLASGKVIEEIVIFALLSIPIIFFFENGELYRYHVITDAKKHTYNLVKTIFGKNLFYLVFCTMIFKLSAYYQSRLFLLIFFVLSLLLFFVFRIVLLRKLFNFLLTKGYFKRKVILYGEGKRGQEVKELIKKGNRWNFLAFFDDDPNTKNADTFGNFDDLLKYMKNYKVDDIVITIDKIEHDKLLKLIEKLGTFNARLYIRSDLYNILGKTQKLEVVDGIPLVQLNYFANSFYAGFTKKLIDTILAMFGLIFLSPLLITVALIIKLTSKGPIFFSQIRVGKNGKEFKFYKFRSMKVNNSTTKHKDFVTDFIKGKTTGTNKIKNDPRITAIGRFIRKTSIDELPQLFNVIKGDMSLVGPRPCLPYEYEAYKDWHKIRFMVQPGCTGIWQVSGRSEVSFEDMIVLDYFYIHNMSPWMDIKIMVQTVPVMIFGQGGY